MRKRILSLVLAGTLAMGMTACSSSSESTTAAETSQTTQGETTQEGGTDSAYSEPFKIGIAEV